MPGFETSPHGEEVERYARGISPDRGPFLDALRAQSERLLNELKIEVVQHEAEQPVPLDQGPPYEVSNFETPMRHVLGSILDRVPGGVVEIPLSELISEEPIPTYWKRDKNTGNVTYSLTPFAKD